MAFTQASAANAWYEDQLLTRAVPTTSTSDGVPMKDMDAITVVLEADSGATISGGGSLVCYLYDPTVAAWFRSAENDVTSITPSAVRRASFNFVVSGARSATRVMWACSSVTTSAGTTARLFIIGARERGN